MNSQEKLHLLTSKFVQLVVLPPTATLDRQLYALTEHGHIWNYDESANRWHFIDAERQLPK